jgi:hypothetical protein
MPTLNHRSIRYSYKTLQDLRKLQNHAFAGFYEPKSLPKKSSGLAIDRVSLLAINLKRPVKTLAVGRTFPGSYLPPSATFSISSLTLTGGGSGVPRRSPCNVPSSNSFLTLPAERCRFEIVIMCDDENNDKIAYGYGRLWGRKMKKMLVYFQFLNLLFMTVKKTYKYQKRTFAKISRSPGFSLLRVAFLRVRILSSCPSCLLTWRVTSDSLGPFTVSGCHLSSSLLMAKPIFSRMYGFRT